MGYSKQESIGSHITLEGDHVDTQSVLVPNVTLEDVESDVGSELEPVFIGDYPEFWNVVAFAKYSE